MVQDDCRKGHSEGCDQWWAYLALSLLLAMCALFGVAMIAAGAWDGVVPAIAVFALLSLIWPALDDHSGLSRHQESMDEIRVMQVRSMHVITQHTAADWPEIIPSDGSDIG